jgi:O-antigen/teichoic acid export membrane protein
VRRQSLSRNVFTNSAAYLITLAAAFVMFPIMIHKLGAARYGLWMLISEVTAYYSYVGLGIRAGVVYYAASYLAQQNHRDLNQIVSTSFWSLAGTGLVLAAATLGLVSVFPAIFGSGGLDPKETSNSILILGCTIALSLPVEALNSTLTAAKRLDVVNGIEIVIRMVSSAATLVCVLQGGGLVALSFVQLGTRVFTAPWTYVATRRILAGLSLDPRLFRLSRLGQLVRFGLPSVIMGVGWVVSSRTDLVVIGMALGVSSIAYYAVPRSLMDYADAGIRAVTLSFTSHLTHLRAEERIKDAIQLYLGGTRIASLAAFLLTAYILAFGTTFLALWQGDAFVSGPWPNRSSVVLLILVAAFLPRLVNNMTTQWFYAMNHLAVPMWISVVEGIVKISLSFALVWRYGLAGVAISNLIPMLIFEGVAIPLYMLRRFALPRRQFLKDAIGRPLFAGIPAYLAGALLIMWHQPSGWPMFILEAALAGIVGISALVAIGVTRHDRDEFIVWLHSWTTKRQRPASLPQG